MWRWGRGAAKPRESRAQEGFAAPTGKLAVIVVAHGMRRELPRTLHSLGLPYQRDISLAEYDVLVVDNGSDPPWEEHEIRAFGDNFSLLRMPNPAPSPVGAVNAGAAHSSAQRLCVMIDGARIATPRLLAGMRDAARVHPQAVVTAPSWHLGPALQWQSLAQGYSAEVEDEMLSAADWMSDGYRLFGIAVPGASSADAPFAPMAESNTLGLSRALFEALGGMDPRFDQPGGGYANLDLYRRAVNAPGSRLFVLLGESSFHQVHGGVSTNAPEAERRAYGARARERYREIRAADYVSPDAEAHYLGPVSAAALPSIAESARRTSSRHSRQRPLSLLFCIDAEPDAFMPVRNCPEPWHACEHLLETVETVRAALGAACGHVPAFNWFLRADPQIEAAYGDAGWGVRRFRAEWHALLEKGDVLGLHPHAQRWDDASGDWRCPADEDAWAVHCLETGVRAMRDELGVTPRALRFGNRFISAALLRSAGELGIEFDMTAEPGYPGRTGPAAAGCVGPANDYRAWPRTPYMPHPIDIHRPGPADMKLPWIVPMSSIRVAQDAGAAYETLMLKMHPALFRQALDEALGRADAAYLSFVARSDMFALQEAKTNLETLCSHPGVSRFRYETPSAVLGRLGLDPA